jgi:hypothetical protein
VREEAPAESFLSPFFSVLLRLLKEIPWEFDPFLFGITSLFLQPGHIASLPALSEGAFRDLLHDGQDILIFATPAPLQ